MMFSLKRGSIAPARWKWPHKTELPLTTKLLRDVPPEIELSDYRKLPSSGPDSPSGLLNDERLDSELIIDLDLFFERLYSYYCQKGLWCIIIKWIVELLYVIFMVGFTAFFLLYVDWDALGKAKCGVEAVELGEKPCDLPKEVIKQHPLVPFTIGKAIIIGSMVILILYGLLNFLKFFVQLKNIVKIRHFYYNRLNVTDREIQTTPWPTILEKVVQLQKSQKLCVVKDLSAHDVVMRIMRKQNYLIAMLNKGVLAFSISSWVPGAGSTVKSRITGKKNHLILPKILEWSLSWCIFQSMFDSKFCLQRDFLTNPTSLRKRLVYLGIGMFLISPCLLIFMLVHLFLRHAEQFYHHPSTASSRRWSNLSKWIFREFNEVDHLFMHRLNNSVIDASNYLKQFPSPLISILAKFVSFVSGGFAAILIIIAFLDESLLEGQIFGRNLFWYAAVFGTVTAISRAVITDELQAHDPEGAMSLVVQSTHYMPKKWRGRENSDAVRAEFETLFQYTGMMLLEEMASIFVTPYLLIFVVPKHVDDILQFISKFTVYVHGVGDVCSFSSFDFQSHGNRKYASPSNAERDKSSQGKMEKSFLSFKSIYPCWEPDMNGHQFLSNLHKFRERQTHLAYSRAVRDNTSDHPWNSMFRWNDKSELTQRFLSREVQQKAQGMSPRHKLDYFLSMNPSQRTHPYILDWYYTTILLDPAIISTDFHPSAKEVIARPSDSMWSLQNKQSSEIEDTAWQSRFSDRLQSHMEASTSRPLFREDYDPQHPVLEPHNMEHWWNRSGPQLSGPQASFMEPPTFGEQHLNFHHDHGSERSEEQAKSDVAADDEWEAPNSMFKTMYNNSDSDDAFDLHFTDEKGKSSFVEPTNHDVMPSVSIPVRIIPSSNDPVWFRGK